MIQCPVCIIIVRNLWILIFNNFIIIISYKVLWYTNKHRFYELITFNFIHKITKKISSTELNNAYQGLESIGFFDSDSGFGFFLKMEEF